MNDQRRNATPRLLDRRGFLQLGGLGWLGLTLPALLRAEATVSRRQARARSCLLFFMEGGPAHQDLWDMKPEAPLEYRGEFKSISTTVPGVQVCEHLPLLSRQMHHLALVRSVAHAVNDHNAGAYYALTGHSPVDGAQLIREPSDKLFPNYGAVLAKLRPGNRPLPDFVQIPEVLSNLGVDLPGQFAGFLGGKFDPYFAGDPSLDGYKPPTFTLSSDTGPERFRRRQGLFAKVMDGALARLGDNDAFREMGSHYQKAFELLGSPAARKAFDLGEESPEMRERYGFDRSANRSKLAREFGGVPHLGQSMLLARRLLEAGVRLVTVSAGRRYCQAWDTHRQHFPLMKRSLLPLTDKAFSALIEDLSQRGLLEETLVVVMGEFGRTPKVGQITSDAGADKGGRDHWPHCYTVLFAGAGVTGGAVYGKSDKYAAYPVENPVGPEDIAATIYDAMGLNPDTFLYDRLDRAIPLSSGKPLRALFS